MMRRTIPVLLTALIAVGAYFLFQEAVRIRLEQVGTRVAGDGYRLHIGQVRTLLLQGGATVRNIRLEFDTLRADSLLRRHPRGLLTVNAQGLRVHGLNYWALFRRGQVIVERIEVDAPELKHLYRSGIQANDSLDRADPPHPAQLPAAILIDSLIVRNAEARTIDLTGRRPSADLARTDIRIGGVYLATLPAEGILVDVRSAGITMKGIRVALPPLYDLRMEGMQLDHPSGEARITGMQLIPRANEQHYGELVDHETDLFQFTLDTLKLSGLDVAGFLANGTYHLHKLSASGPEVDIFRDKTLPDAPWQLKLLPTGSLASLNASIAVDSVHITDARITYHERDSLGPDFGGITFAALQAVVTGLDNRPPGSRSADQIRLHAQARIYDRSSIRLELTAPLDDPDGSFSVSAYMNAIPFQFFNRMTDSLLHVEASSGRIHHLVMHMNGNDRSGKGTVDMAYEDLRIAIRGQKGSRLGRKLLRLAANTAVRGSNVHGHARYRQGEFVVQRRRDRGLLNFIWGGLKAGALDIVVPGILRNAVRKAAGNEAGKKQDRTR